MLISVKSKDHYGNDILINSDRIQYIVPNGDMTIFYFSKTEFVVVTESFDSIKDKIFPKSEKILPKFSTITEDKSASIDVSEYKDLDTYPANLPRLPTGFVDKRTTAYKEYIADSKVSNSGNDK